MGSRNGVFFYALGTVLLRNFVQRGDFAAVFGGIVVLFLSGKGKKTEMPFVPFLMLGYIGGLIY